MATGEVLSASDVIPNGVPGLGEHSDDDSVASHPLKTAPAMDPVPQVPYANGTEEEPPAAPAEPEEVCTAVEAAVEAEEVQVVSREGVEGFEAAEPPPGAAVSAPASDSLAQPPETAHKGILGSAPAPSTDAEASGGASGVLKAAQVVEKVPTVREFFLVKVPRPDLTTELNRIKIIEMTLKEKRERQSYFSAALRLKQAARSDAFDALHAARDRHRACNAEVKKKFDEARPLQDMLKKVNEEGSAARARKRGMEASTEAELNELIAQKEYRMQHDDITLKEEKQLMKEIQQLEASRAKVRETEALNATVADSLTQKEGIQAMLKPLLAEADVLKQERDAAQKICETFEAEAKVCDEAVKELLAERAAAKQDEDAVYDELRALRSATYKKEEDFRQYRRDVAAAQEMGRNKDVAALDKFCPDQVERIHAKLNGDKAYRLAYVSANQWSTIRRFKSLDTRRLGIDEDPAGLLEPSGGGGGGGAKSSSRSSEGGGGSVGGVPAKGKAAAAKTASVAAAADSGQEEDGEGDPEKTREVAEGSASGVPGKKRGGEGGAKEQAGAGSRDVKGKQGGGKAEGEGRVLTGRTPSPAPLPLAAATAAGLGDGGSAADSDGGADEKERRRQEAMVKAKEAEERKKKISERAQQRAESRAAKEAEEAAKRREKEREKRARKKAAQAEKKAAEKGDASGTDADKETDTDAAEARVDSDDASGVDQRAEAQSGQGLTKRQRKRMGKGKGEAADGTPSLKLSEGKKGGHVWLYALAAVLVAVLIAIAILIKNSGFFAPNLVFSSNEE